MEPGEEEEEEEGSVAGFGWSGGGGAQIFLPLIFHSLPHPLSKRERENCAQFST